MKNGIILIYALAILWNGQSANADVAKPPTFEAEYHFRKVYLLKPKFKAMAVGLSGSFGTSWDMETPRRRLLVRLTLSASFRKFEAKGWN